MADTSVARPNYLAMISFVLGLLGLLVALTAPIPFVPILSAFTWPFGLGAMLTGWAARRVARTNGDAQPDSRARWGIRLGCAGWIVQFATSVVKVILIGGFLTYLLGSWIGLWPPQPTPTP